MHVRHVKGGLLAFAFVASLAMAGAPSAQAAEAKQVLDTVAIFGPGRVDKADFLNGDTDPGVSVGAGEKVRACQLTAGSGLYCLVRKPDGIIYVVNWSNPASSNSARTLFACAGISDLDSKSADVCTGLTLDLEGNIWIAGKNKGKTHNLVKVVKGNPGSWTKVTGTTDYFWKNWATGRPLLVDITSVDGEEAGKFALGRGVIGLQERKIVVFVPAAEPPDPSKSAIEIASGRTGWGLETKEELQGVTFEAVDGPNDMVYVTTSKGRILAKNLNPLDTSVPTTVSVVPDSAADTGGLGCSTSSPQYGIRRSGKSGLVYVTNRGCSNLYALNPVTAWTTDETIPTSEPPEGPTVAPGIGVNLSDPNCASSSGCEPVDGFRLSLVDLSSEESGLTLFQVRGIPDCRYVPETCRTLLGDPNLDLRAAGVIVVQSGVGEPHASDPAVQYLNVTPLLPVEITSLYESSGGLPDMLISPQYHAQPRSVTLADGAPDDYLFEAFFGKAEDNLLFNGTFDTIFKVGILAGRENGCLDSDTAPKKAGEVAGIPEDLLRWDIATRVSEKYVSTPSGPAYIDTMINTDCGSLKGSFGGFSLIAYDLEPTRDTYIADPEHPELSRVVANNDAVFARLLQQLYNELGVVTRDLACTTYDVPKIKDTNGILVDNPNAPISPGICATLNTTWANGWDKLDKCLKATYQPKTSYGDQNCQAFLSQFKNFNDALAIVGPYGLDPANRKGELAARSKVIDYVYRERFVPSIPDGGFCVESDTCK